MSKAFLLAFLAAGCLQTSSNQSTLTVPEQEETLASVDPGADEHCLRLGETACQRDARCQVLVEPCRCPPSLPAGECRCSGGVFRGCAPQRCPDPACGPARPLLLDEHGCLRCGGPLECGDAALELRRNCGMTPEELAGLHCERDPECVNDCLHAVASCAQIGCGLCDACDCGRVGSLERCVLGCPAEYAAK